MEDCRWLKPVLVGQVEFVEWTEDAGLRGNTRKASEPSPDCPKVEVKVIDVENQIQAKR
jgi:hypothetical protein